MLGVGAVKRLASPLWKLVGEYRLGGLAVDGSTGGFDGGADCGSCCGWIDT